MDRRGPVGGMTYDPVSDRLIVYDNEDVQFYVFSRDGSAELLLDLSGIASRVLATKSRDVLFQSLNVNGNTDLTRIDLSTGLTSRVLRMSEGRFMEGTKENVNRNCLCVLDAGHVNCGMRKFQNL